LKLYIDKKIDNKDNDKFIIVNKDIINHDNKISIERLDLANISTLDYDSDKEIYKNGTGKNSFEI
jgi:hypothetical protein